MTESEITQEEALDGLDTAIRYLEYQGQERIVEDLLSVFGLIREDTDTERCSIVGCERTPDVTTALSPDAVLDRGATRIKEIRANGTVFVIECCLQCRRALEFGTDMSDYKAVDEWNVDELAASYRSESHAVYREIDPRSDDPSESNS